LIKAGGRVGYQWNTQQYIGFALVKDCRRLFNKRKRDFCLSDLHDWHIKHCGEASGRNGWQVNGNGSISLRTKLFLEKRLLKK
jgi:hypothetical protein